MLNVRGLCAALPGQFGVAETSRLLPSTSPVDHHREAEPCPLSCPPFMSRFLQNGHIMHRNENIPQLSLETWLVTWSIFLSSTYFLEKDKRTFLRLHTFFGLDYTSHVFNLRICVFKTHSIFMNDLDHEYDFLNMCWSIVKYQSSLVWFSHFYMENLT